MHVSVLIKNYTHRLGTFALVLLWLAKTAKKIIVEISWKSVRTCRISIEPCGPRLCQRIYRRRLYILWLCDDLQPL